MNIEEALKPVDKDQLSQLSRRDLIDLLLCEQDLRMRVIEKLKAQADEFFELADKYIPNPKKSGLNFFCSNFMPSLCA